VIDFGLDDDGQELDCPECGGEGFLEAECDEDTCCCLPGTHDIVPCPICSKPEATS
jgi:hypothetical protein